eukprot:CAMPEP_0197447038 /NCGR_PEP_ID=MMETSP1175-20131217/11787_1 /TAXON_ID=1003142 /ORGANISM="Triceratium dubium, Strain CCMP147" /LENGTH=237 /DNA_ID=CAMNT_0042978219 /DNA_START=40 /DNA_END=753 /DNA_ORIENTATION=+
MVKVSQLVLLGLASSAAAFQPASLPQSRAFVVRPTYMSDEETAAVAAPVTTAAADEPAGALVPIKEETVEFTAGLLGGAAGFVIGGPVLGAIGAAAANFASKTDREVGEVVSAVSKTAIEVYNYLAKLDAKYELLGKAQDSLEAALEKVKANENVDPETVKKVEKALESTTSKIKEINEEYDLVGAGSTALGVVGDLVEKAVTKAGELNSEYSLTEKAQESLSKAVDKAKEAAKKNA